MKRLHRLPPALAPAAALTLGAGTPPASARQPADPPSGAPAPSTTFREPAPEPQLLHVAVTPYVWLTSFSGETGVAGLTFDIDESFLDLVDQADGIFGLMGAIDAEYKRLVFQLNGTYSHAEFSGERSRFRGGPGGGGAGVEVGSDIEVDAGWFEALGGYRFVEKPVGKEPDSNSRFTLDGFLGARITSMELKQDVTADAMITLPDGRVLEAGTERGLDQKESWFEPFLGAKAGLDLGKHWSLHVRGDIGGFGVDDSDFAWQAVAGAGYRWQCDGWTFALFGGYRALGQDYSRAGFTWDAVTHGPILGAQFSFSF